MDNGRFASDDDEYAYSILHVVPPVFLALRPDRSFSYASVLISKFYLQSSRYKAYYERFRSIFTVDPSTSVLYIPGNHDVG